jgi:hypothetical protein
MMDTQELKKEIAELDSKAETLVARLNETLQLIKLKREMLYRIEFSPTVKVKPDAPPQY